MKNLTTCQDHGDAIVIHNITEACPLCRMQDEVDDLNRQLNQMREEENVNER